MSLLIQKIEAGLAAQVKQHLDAGGTEITVASMGGDLVEAMNVSKVIAESGKDVTCRVLANCGSAANTILLACKNRVCYSDSMFMTHRPQISATGTVDQVVASANAGAMAEQSLKASFGAHADALLGDSERWLTADEAKQYGLVTEVLATQAPADQQQILNMVKSLRVGSNVVPFKHDRRPSQSRRHTAKHSSIQSNDIRYANADCCTGKRRESESTTHSDRRRAREQDERECRQE